MRRKMISEWQYYFRWFCRRLLTQINKLLARFMKIEILKTYLTKIYFRRTIDLVHPQKLNEKILWLEYHTDDSLRSRLSDKYRVRQYVAEKGYEQTLVPLYGYWNRLEDIDFDSLPQRFVLKAAHGCDMNYICMEKDKKEIRKMKRRIKLWMKTNLAYMSLEMHYLSVKKGVICEQYLDDNKGDIVDYKFHCSDGKARFVLVCTNRTGENYRNVYDLDWNPLHVVTGVKENPCRLERPACFPEMIKMADCLAEGIPFVRVDLYAVKEKVYFGEMTFTPATGVLFHFQDDFLLEQGKYCTVDFKKGSSRCE